MPVALNCDNTTLLKYFGMSILNFLMFKYKYTLINYFQKIWILNKVAAKTNDIAVFILIDSSKKIYVNIVKVIIPKPNAINLPGHTCPSKYSAEYLVAHINK